MPRDLQLSTFIAAPPQVVYDAWLDPVFHQAISGAAAVIQPRVGGAYSLWGGSISGEFVFLQRPSRIAQTWRTEDFQTWQPDSRVEIRFLPQSGGTRFAVLQDQIPDPLLEQFRFGWSQHIFPRLMGLGLQQPGSS